MLKYIIYEENCLEQCLLFSFLWDHSFVATNFLQNGLIVSAGKVKIVEIDGNNEIYVSSGSVTLKIPYSEERTNLDKEILKRELMRDC